MELEIYWTAFSEKELEKIFEFHIEKASVRIANKLIVGIFNETLTLKKQQSIGQVEDLLKERKENFRYLVYKKYKIIYWVNHQENRVEITDIFDTRQNPRKIKRTK